MAVLDRHGIEHFGGGVTAADAHAPLVIERNGVRVALLSYTLAFSSKAGFNTREWRAREDRPGVAIGWPSDIGPAVASARQQADVVLVAVHSGGEFRPRPKRNQVRFARAAIDAGATVVIGHGPHNLQGYVREGNTLIAYSIGNFVFDDYVGRQNETAILDVTLTPKGVESVNWIPVQIENGLPRPATAQEAARIARQLAPMPAVND
jgi:poly-gamma-glutamate synthesis protein (capsule biosynthesis protein)